MDDMQAVYDEEVNGGSYGLMSILRGAGDMVLGEDIMNRLPEILRAFEGTNINTQKGLRDISRPMEKEGFALELSTTPGLESLVGPEIGLALGALGVGGKGRSIKELLSGRGMEGFQNMKESLLKLTQRITTWHVKLFDYLTRKSKTSLFFTWLLVFICLYEIFEHVFIPLFLIWWGFS